MELCPRTGGLCRNAARVVQLRRAQAPGELLIVCTSATFIRRAFVTPVTFAAAAAVALAFSDAAMAREAKGAAHHATRAASAETKKDSKSAETKKDSKSAETKKDSKSAETKPGSKHAKRSAAADRKKRDRSASSDVPKDRPAPADLPPELAAVQKAFDLIRKGKFEEATALQGSIEDPVARKLVEWMLLRRGDSNVGFSRYIAFINENPDWPSIPLLRRRAEARLWQQRRDAGSVQRFVGDEPAGVYGELALARVLLAGGDRAAAERNVRAAWHDGELSGETETAVLEQFPGLLTRADHFGRMDRRIGAKDFTGAMRAAHRLGDGAVAIVKACVAAEADAKKAKSLLDAVPSEARDDIGYALCRIHWLRHQNDLAAAAKAMLATDGTAVERLDTDEWWRERRILARKLLDQGDAKTAYQIVAGAAAPANVYYRSEWQFMQGWIALRFLGDVAAARAHFAHIGESTIDPLVQARGAYWRGRAAEAAGDRAAMRTEYETAARYSTAYYGQLARARLGLAPVELRPVPDAPAQDLANELLHATEILYTIGERDLVVPFTTDFAEHGCEPATLAALAQLTRQHDDAKATMLIGKMALARGLALEHYAFPDIGVPRYASIGQGIDRSIVFSVARTESEFDQRDSSPAKAVGLLQVTPEAGRDTAKRFGVAYDWKKLVSDPVYNTQMGAGELEALLKEYRGSFIMTFAGYNAGRGRVQEWVAKYGDPRDPKVDAVDWVERIPFSETRNYVQRVMENLAVYRARFGDANTVALEPSLHRATTNEARGQ
jgi:soluble lytic murein transglycosylase